AKRWLRECDVIFAVGTSLTTGIFSPKIPPGKRFVHATVDPRDLNKDQVAEVGLVGDARLILRQMIDELVRQQGTEPVLRRKAVEREIAAGREAWRARWRPKLASNEV